MFFLSCLHHEQKGQVIFLVINRLRKTNQILRQGAEEGDNNAAQFHYSVTDSSV